LNFVSFYIPVACRKIQGLHIQRQILFGVCMAEVCIKAVGMVRSRTKATEFSLVYRVDNDSEQINGD